jgi:uncharacterized protein (DUF2461 family)
MMPDLFSKRRLRKALLKAIAAKKSARKSDIYDGLKILGESTTVRAFSGNQAHQENSSMEKLEQQQSNINEKLENFLTKQDSFMDKLLDLKNKLKNIFNFLLRNLLLDLFFVLHINPLAHYLHVDLRC